MRRLKRRGAEGPEEKRDHKRSESLNEQWSPFKGFLAAVFLSPLPSSGSGQHPSTAPRRFNLFAVAFFVFAFVSSLRPLRPLRFNLLVFVFVFVFVLKPVASSL